MALAKFSSAEKARLQRLASEQPPVLGWASRRSAGLDASLQIKIEIMKSYLTVILILAPASILCAKSFRSPNPTPSVYWKDVDGDRKPDKFTYQIKRWEKDYEGRLRIVSAQGRVLWEHEYPIAEDDLDELLSTEGDVTGKKVTLADWVRRFFSGKLTYGARIDLTKIKTEDIDAEQLDYAAKLAGISSRSLETEILSQEINMVVSYRAEWREDLMMIVYIPSLKKFVCHSRGYEPQSVQQALQADRKQRALSSTTAVGVVVARPLKQNVLWLFL